MVLSSKQQEELNLAILGYFKKSGYEEAYQAFQKTTKLTPDSKHETVLEKKWRSIIRLQKKIFTLEATNRQLTEDLENAGRGGSKKRDTSLALPRDFARHALSNHRGAITVVVFHPVYSQLVTGGEDSTLKIWDYESGKLERTLKGHSDAVQSAHFNPSGGMLVSSSTDMSIKVWNFETYECVKTLNGHDHNVSCVRYLPSGDQVVSCSRDKKLKLWDIPTGFCTRTYSGHEGWVRQVAVSPDGQIAASCSSDETIRLWEIKTGKCLATMKDHEHVVEAIAFSDAKADETLVTFLDNKTKIDGIDNKKEEKYNIKDTKHTPDGSQNSTNNNNNSGGQFLVSGSRDLKIKIWHVPTATCVKTLVGHDNWVRSVLFHPSGKFIVSSSDDKSICVWDLTKNGRLIKKIEKAHDQFVTCLDWNRTIPLLASGGTDGIAKIWEAA